MKSMIKMTVSRDYERCHTGHRQEPQQTARYSIICWLDDRILHHYTDSGKLEWRVLVVDALSMKMVSACTKMHELSAEGITSKSREPTTTAK